MSKPFQRQWQHLQEWFKHKVNLGKSFRMLKSCRSLIYGPAPCPGLSIPALSRKQPPEPQHASLLQVTDPFVAYCKQDAEPDILARSFAVGFSLGLCPIVGEQFFGRTASCHSLQMHSITRRGCGGNQAKWGTPFSDCCIPQACNHGAG